MFNQFAALIHAQWVFMSKYELFTTISGDALWELYLKAFPAGTNPIFRERTEHDCSCCRNFIKNIGNTVALIDGQLVSVWNVMGAPAPYDAVTKAMAASVKGHPITGLFRTKENSYGAEKNHEHMANGSVHTWHHFHGQVAKKHKTNTPDKARGNYAIAAQVFYRGLMELSFEAIEDVLSLINENALYRGAEFKNAVVSFYDMKRAFLALDAQQRDQFVWANAASPVARFRNTVIGTLVTDLSEGMGLEAAVRSFETKVAPINYKRPSALITKGMIDQAMKTVQQLDLESALERRHARMSDITINNVLWADNSAKAQMKGGVDALSQMLLSSVQTSHTSDKAEPIGIEAFMSQVVPSAQSMELYVSNKHATNFMSLTAPVHADVAPLFKWSNNFGWSYDGNITDSIKEKVKAAGGNVNAKLRVSLAWYNYDDLDLHCFMPNGGRVYFGNKRGILDVDMNAGWGTTREPVENMAFTSLENGTYLFIVDQFNLRETSNGGFALQVESDLGITQFAYKKVLKGEFRALAITVKAGQVVDLQALPGMELDSTSVEKWGVNTETFIKVNTLMHSPNHWDGNQDGNKHWFFILDGCKNDLPTRGIYNEFLRGDLTEHRKVFEVLGDKTTCPVVDEQLSGIGFSSTRNDVATIAVIRDSRRKLYEVTF